MKKTSLKTVSILAFVFAGSVAMAQTAWDTDGDGAYSFEELMVAVPTLTAEGFAELDSDSDGIVSEAEMATAIESGMVVIDG